MRFSKKELNIMKDLEDEIALWDEPKTIPVFKGLKPREKIKAIEDWKSNVYLWEEGDMIYFSGGAKIFYWIRALLHKDDYSNMIKWILKHRNWNQLRELKKIQKREQQLGYKFKCKQIAKGFKNFEYVEIMGEEI